MNRANQAFVAAVERAITDADPIGLLRGGAPADEYSPEICTVVPRIARAERRDEVTEILHQEFLRWFGERPPGRVTYTKLPRLEFGTRCWSIGGPAKRRQRRRVDRFSS
jgi:hypothetical protein